jgi:hypothetical protein
MVCKYDYTDMNTHPSRAASKLKDAVIPEERLRDVYIQLLKVMKQIPYHIIDFITPPDYANYVSTMSLSARRFKRI